jgi:hypothetical protein
LGFGCLKQVSKSPHAFLRCHVSAPSSIIAIARRRERELSSLKIHLVECQKVQRVMILSDTIHTPSFDKDYLRWIRAWSGRGVTFGHALVAPDRRTLLPVPLGV